MRKIVELIHCNICGSPIDRENDTWTILSGSGFCSEVDICNECVHKALHQVYEEKLTVLLPPSPKPYFADISREGGLVTSEKKDYPGIMKYHD